MAETAKTGRDLVEHADHIELDGHVALTSYGIRACLVAACDHAFGRFALRPEVHGDIVAAPRRKLRDRRTNATTAARNQQNGSLLGHMSAYALKVRPCTRADATFTATHVMWMRLLGASS